MPRLTRPRGDRTRRDRGAVSVIVAVLLAGGVLLGMTALVVDVGQLYAEREELQSGADAAAMAIALDCAKGRPECSTAGVRNTAERLATANARDGFANASTVCGRDGGGPLNACPSNGDNLTACLDVRSPGAANHVEVRTSTQTRDGTLLPPFLAGAVTPGYTGTTVGACARVAWGTPRGGLGLTLSDCEWRQATRDGTRFAPAPPAAVPAGLEQVIFLKTPAGDASCPAGPPGFDRPGGFGWLADADRDCRVTIPTSNTYRGDAGAAAPSGCRDALAAAVGRVRAIPVFDRASSFGSNTTYRLYGMAAFVVTGYRVPGDSARSTLTGSVPCRPSEVCVSGYFVDTVVDWDDPIAPDGRDLGAVAIRTIG